MSSDSNTSTFASIKGDSSGDLHTISETDDVAIHVTSLSKCYQIYDSPRDRLKQFIIPRLKRFIFQRPKQYFREFWALKDVSFSIKKGETVGIIGKNGSGKSTLLQIICSTLFPNGGTVDARGRIAALLELGSGFNPEFTGRENVYMNASVLGLSKEEVDTRFADIAAFADIGDFIDQPVKSYSSGMVVRLAFAVAIHADPEILIIDEALSVGDELFQRKCFSRIEAIKNNGTTILFVSHSATTVVELCDRAVLLDGGELLAFDLPKLIVEKYQKLLYAPLNKRERVLEEIRLIRQNKNQTDLDEVTKIASHKSHEQQQVGAIDEFFDPHLIPESTFEFESHSVHIKNPQIKNLQGLQVNNLVRNQRYKYSYEVKFEQPASCVRFGMVMKTISGFRLGGAHSTSSGVAAIPLVEAGSTVFVEFSFNCYVNPGLYFLNAGVFGLVEKNEIVLHRIVDAATFRVQPVENNLVTEIIDFGFVPEVKVSV